MRRARDFLGLPVLSVESGNQVGNARDLLIDETWNIQGIILETRHWFSSLKYVQWDDVIACGEDAITIPDESTIRTLEEGAHLNAFLTGKRSVKGLPVITVNGHQLGMVEDVYFDDQMGRQIVGYELSEGFISDLREGRKWLPLPENVTRGADAIIVPVHCDEEVEELFVSKEE